MKHNNQTMSKRGKIAATVIALLLACCLIVSGVMLFKPQKSSMTDAATDVSTVTVTADKTEINAGDEVTFTFVLSSTRTGQDWFAVQILLMPMVNGSADYDLGDAFSLVGTAKKPGRFDENFDEFTSATTVKLPHATYGINTGILLTLTYTGTSYDLSNPCTYEATLKLSDSYSGSLDFTWGFAYPAVDNITSVANGNPLGGERTKDKPGDGSLVIVSPTFAVNSNGGGGNGPSQPEPVLPTLNTVAYSLTSATASDFQTISAAGATLDWTIGTDANVGDNIYFKVTVPDGAVASPVGSLTASGTTNVFRGSLAYGTNTFQISVQGSSTSQTYTFTVKLLERVNTIDSITSTDFSISFNAATLTYTAEVENSVSSVELKVTLAGDHETLSASGAASNTNTGKVYTLQYNLTEGQNTITLKGVGDDGVNGTTYTINITRKGPVGASLNSVEYSLTSATAGFQTVNAAGATIDLTLGTQANVGSNIYFKVTLPDGATATPVAPLGNSGTENVFQGSLVYGVNTFQIRVQGTSASQTYTFTVNLLERVNAISSVTSNDFSISFNPSTTTYNVSVDNDVSSVEMKVTLAGNYETLNASGSPMSSNTGNVYTLQYSLSVGQNTITLKGVGDDNVSGTTYTINITRAQATSTPPQPDPPASQGEAILSAIYINRYNEGNGYGSEISGFDPYLTEYTIYVPSDASHPRITAVAADPNASIIMKVNGQIMDTGNLGVVMDDVYLEGVGAVAQVEFIVTTDMGSRTYRLYVTRSTQSPYLSYLTVGSYPVFDASGRQITQALLTASNTIRDFYVTIENADTMVNVVAQASPANATAQVWNNGQISVAELFGNSATADLTINVVILDDNGNPISANVMYTLHLTRKPALNDSTNARIIIDEITTQYNAKIFNDEYAANWETKFVYGTPYHVPYNVAALTIHIYPDAIGDLVAPPTYQIFYGDVLKNDNGTENANLHLDYGVNVVIITLTSSDGTASRTIAVIVYREEPSLFPNPSILEIPDFANEYTAEVTDYAYTVGHNVTKLTVLLLRWDESLYTCVVSENANDLKVGLNTITICLYEKGGQGTGVSKTAASTNAPEAVRTITLSVFRENTGPSTVWLILFIIFLLLAILEFIILLLLLLRNRKETEVVKEKVVVTHHTPAPAPVVKPVVAPIAPVAPMHVVMPPAPVQYVAVPQPQPQPTVVEKPQQPVNVEVKITGMGESDGHYKTKNNNSSH